MRIGFYEVNTSNHTLKILFSWSLSDLYLYIFLFFIKKVYIYNISIGGAEGVGRNLVLTPCSFSYKEWIIEDKLKLLLS
jgi:hypothetical protein